MARAPGRRLGSALSVAHAASQAAALRELMNTLEAPAWRRLGGGLVAGMDIVGVVILILGFGGGLRGGGAEAEAAGPAGYDGDFAFEGEEGGEIVELGFGHGDGLGGMGWIVCDVMCDMTWVLVRCVLVRQDEQGIDQVWGNLKSIGVVDDRNIYLGYDYAKTILRFLPPVLFIREPLLFAGNPGCLGTPRPSASIEWCRGPTSAVKPGANSETASGGFRGLGAGVDLCFPD